MFTPEFRNRLDAIVPFAYLPAEAVSRVVDKFILQLELQLADQQRPHPARLRCARCGSASAATTSSMARARWRRLIQEKVKQPLAEELLFGKLVHGGEVHVSVKEDKLAFELTPAPPKVVKPRKAKAKAGKKPSQAADGGF